MNEIFKQNSMSETTTKPENTEGPASIKQIKANDNEDGNEKGNGVIGETHKRGVLGKYEDNPNYDLGTSKPQTDQKVDEANKDQSTCKSSEEDSDDILKTFDKGTVSPNVQKSLETFGVQTGENVVEIQKTQCRENINNERENMNTQEKKCNISIEADMSEDAQTPTTTAENSGTKISNKNFREHGFAIEQLEVVSPAENTETQKVHQENIELITERLQIVGDELTNDESNVKLVPQEEKELSLKSQSKRKEQGNENSSDNLIKKDLEKGKPEQKLELTEPAVESPKLDQQISDLEENQEPQLDIVEESLETKNISGTETSQGNSDKKIENQPDTKIGVEEYKETVDLFKAAAKLLPDDSQESDENITEQKLEKDNKTEELPQDTLEVQKSFETDKVPTVSEEVNELKLKGELFTSKEAEKEEKTQIESAGVEIKKPSAAESKENRSENEAPKINTMSAKEQVPKTDTEKPEDSNNKLPTKDLSVGKSDVELEEKPQPTENVNDIMAVIEIDDDNSEASIGKLCIDTKIDEAPKQVNNLEENVVESNDNITKESKHDIIEIDDDEDIDTNTSKATDQEAKVDETANTSAADQTDEQILKTEEPEKIDNAFIAKMHTMPMIFYKKECINFECPKTHKEFHRAPQFALNYFKITKKKMKIQYICSDCYDMTLGFYQEFCGILQAKQPILIQAIANKKQEFVEILDSSDEEETEANVIDMKEQENPSFSTADLNLIEAELDNTIRNVFDNVEIQNQLTWTKTIFTERVKRLQEELEYIDCELDETQKMADRMYNDLYDSGKYRINSLKALDLDTPSTEVIPPLGEVERPPIKLGGVYYAARNKAIGCWVPCKVIEQSDNYLFVPHYRIKFLNTNFQPFKNISAKLIAYYDPPTVRLTVGQRVIAYFDGTTLPVKDKEKNLVKSAFYPGIVAEEMKPNNFYRYLIFYDDGYTQYVSHKDVRLVCHVARNVWEDVDHVSREFIKKYVQEYRVNRPMVQTHKGQKMCTEKNGRWVPARVIDIDCSLVRMQFEGPKGNHTEWIYRGSLRLNPVYNEYQKSKNANQANRMPVSRLPRRTEPFIRYTDDEENISAQQQQQPSRTLNRSNSATSTTSSTPTVRHLNSNTIYLEDEKPKGKVIYYTAKRQMPSRVYRPHECGSHCLITITHNLNGYNPLAKPLLSGWERLFSRQKIKKTVYYRAPCGKMFRNMKELHHYLRVTNCSLNVDNFDFYAETSCLAEFEAENVHLKKRDISNGQERMPLPLINYYDDTLPECTYSAKVIPTEGVNINTDTNFLICCDCEDDCVDKSKCACWKLTVEGFKTIHPDAVTDDIGYQYKRLYDHLPTGIYECNSRCKCKSHCLNRVVQHSLGLKLQVFKTTNRGWGLRCLNDIPRGSFVCVYAGNLLTEAKANEGGLDAGDEYFAELDYIETVEQLKEGYESDVETQEEDDEDSYEPEPDEDVDFQPSRSVERRVRRGTASSSGNNEGERQAINFNPKVAMEDDSKKKRLSVRQLFGKDEAVYVMDAKVTGNLGRYFNHSCSPNLFVQNVFVDTHDIRFPCVAFFSLTHIRAGTELTWNYNYEVGVVPGKVLYCQCGAPNCRQRLL